jgi:hypothetical protein
MNEIKICSNHQEYKVPLIWTFAFIGAEYWCPYCGYTSGMFGAGVNVKSTLPLRRKLKKYEALSNKFLPAYGSTHAISMMYNKVRYTQEALPEAARIKFKKIVDKWKYRQKV